MSVVPKATVRHPRYAGLRMSADKYRALEDDGFRYELINGVVILSPSPTPRHQSVLFEVSTQLGVFLHAHAIGRAYPETDVRLDDDLVYRPDIVFLRAERVRDNWECISAAPDLMVEIISPEYRAFDTETKKSDYERFGVAEYWLIDPDRDEMKFYRLEAGKYREVGVEGEHFSSEVIVGFQLDLSALRRSFEP